MGQILSFEADVYSVATLETAQDRPVSEWRSHSSSISVLIPFGAARSNANAMLQKAKTPASGC